MSKSAKKLVRQKEFRQVGGKTVTVGIPRQIELDGLAARFRIKPWTKREERSFHEADVKVAQLSLREVR